MTIPKPPRRGNKAILAIRTSKLRPADNYGEPGEEKRKRQENALSPQAQMELARIFRDQKKIDLDEEISFRFADLNVSGSKVLWKKRDGLTNIYNLMRQNNDYGHLMIYKAARAGRNLRDTLDMLDAFESLGVTVHDVREHMDTSLPSGRMMRNILLSVAEYQADDLATTIKDVVLTRAKKGDINGRYPLMWLRRSTNGGYEVIPEMEHAFRRMIALRKEGMGYERTAKRMNEEALRTLHGKLWTGGKVYKYLSPTYIDSMCGVAFLNRDLPPDDDYHVRIADKFPRLLSDEEGDAIRTVQACYRANPMRSQIPGAGTWATNMARVGRVRADSKYLLASVIHCAVCGAGLLSMQHAADRPYQRSYHCPQGRVDPEDLHLGGHQIVADSLEDGVFRVIRHVLQEPPPPLHRPAQRRKRSRTELDVDAEMFVLSQMRTKGHIMESHYERQYRDLKAELDRLKTPDPVDTDVATREAAESILARAGDQITQAQLRQLVLTLVKRVEAVVTLPGVHVRGTKTGLRRHARVCLNIGDADGVDTWLVPLYLPTYGGEKLPPRPVCEAEAV